MEVLLERFLHEAPDSTFLVIPVVRWMIPGFRSCSNVQGAGSASSVLTSRTQQELLALLYEHIMCILGLTQSLLGE